VPELIKLKDAAPRNGNGTVLLIFYRVFPSYPDPSQEILHSSWNTLYAGLGNTSDMVPSTVTLIDQIPIFPYLNIISAIKTGTSLVASCCVAIKVDYVGIGNGYCSRAVACITCEAPIMLSLYVDDI
jgi:hypothetical protein